MPFNDKVVEFFEQKRPEETVISYQLRQIAEDCGPEIFLDKEKLEAEMRSREIPEKTVMQILLMVSVTGFKDVVQGNENVLENDLDRFVGNAQDETGLSRETILILAADISAALGYPVVTNYEQYVEAGRPAKAYVIPYKFYQTELERIHRKMQRSEVLDSVDVKTLTRLTDEGIAEAQLYMSDYLEEKNPEKAEELLQQAAKQGCAEAQAKLGDLYYQDASADNWEHAYECYTGYGAACMTRKRQHALRDILNHKMYNVKMLQMSLLILAAMVLMAVITPAGALYGTNVFLKILFILLDAGVWVAAFIHYRAHPFAFLNWLIPAMSGIWGIYMILWLL